MLDDETYRLYLASRQKQEESRRQKGTPVPPSPAPPVSDLENALEEGRSLLRQIRESNAAIPEKEISAQLDRLDEVGEARCV